MRLHHHTVLTNDLQSTTDFYVRELGLKVIPKSGLDYPGAFLRLNDHQELHIAELPDVPASFRGHCCLRVRNFNALYHRFAELGIIDVEAWGKLRELPGGVIQMYVRDPAGNLVEICSEPEDRAGIDPAILTGPYWGGTPFRSGLDDGRIYRP